VVVMVARHGTGDGGAVVLAGRDVPNLRVAEVRQQRRMLAVDPVTEAQLALVVGAPCKDRTLLLAAGPGPAEQHHVAGAERHLRHAHRRIEALDQRGRPRLPVARAPKVQLARSCCVMSAICSLCGGGGGGGLLCVGVARTGDGEHLREGRRDRHDEHVAQSLDLRRRRDSLHRLAEAQLASQACSTHKHLAFICARAQQ